MKLYFHQLIAQGVWNGKCLFFSLSFFSSSHYQEYQRIQVINNLRILDKYLVYENCYTITLTSKISSKNKS